RFSQAPRALSSFVEFVHGRVTQFRRPAAMPSFFQRRVIREIAESLPAFPSDSQFSASFGISAVVFSECLTNLVQMHEFVCGTGNGRVVAVQQRVESCGTRELWDERIDKFGMRCDALGFGVL